MKSRLSHRRAGVAGLLIVALSAGLVRADDGPHERGTNGPAAGHSVHGDAFNEGPRQAARRVPGTGRVHIGITSAHPESQGYFDQGVGQLQGFWYFEAERSFRQVATLDPKCAMAYWGMAMANLNNTNRARPFIEQARGLGSNASPREVLWIKGLHAYLTGSRPDADRRRDYIKALENIIHEYPDEIEARTFLVFQSWENDTRGVPITSREALDALAREVLAVEPLHPIHHARIHFWNYVKDRRALDSAARCGQSAPGIAHMWHMSGHTYSSLQRYDDAAWQQEAAARTDHAAMIRARILPDQIHNFAHNNEWLCRNLLYCGRVHDAIDLARNMVELPRHPKYNTLNRKEDNTAYDKNHGSSMHGRNRLLDALTQYEMWEELVRLANTGYLDPTELPEEMARRLHALGLAEYSLGRTNQGRDYLAALDGPLKQLRQERFDAAEAAEVKARGAKGGDAVQAMAGAMAGFTARLDQVRSYQNELQLWQAWTERRTNDTLVLFTNASRLPKDRRARWQWQLGRTNEALKLARDLARDSSNQAPALTVAADLFWRAGDRTNAIDVFRQLRAFSGRFDHNTPLLRRLEPIAMHLGYSSDWRAPILIRPDVGDRPPLDSLGPFRWEPWSAPDWTLPGDDDRSISLKDYRGRAVLVVFYLGSGCVHCLEQLNLIAPVAPDFESAGISIVAVSTDSVEGLKDTRSQALRDGGFPFPIVSDHSKAVFKSYGAYDDFERTPLHGAFLIDGAGRVRWQDISFQPFSDVRFLLAESKRLLGLTHPVPPQTAARR